MTDSTYFVKSTPLKSFHWTFSTLCRYTIDIVSMCIKKFDAENNIFGHIYRVFDLAIFLPLHLLNNG